jgi:hypothetical protein
MCVTDSRRVTRNGAAGVPLSSSMDVKDFIWCYVVRVVNGYMTRGLRIMGEQRAIERKYPSPDDTMRVKNST